MTNLTTARALHELSSGDLYDNAITATLQSVSESSQRIYQHAYDSWGDWCANHGISPLDFKHIRAWLVDQPVSHATRKTMLTAMRQLIYTLEAMQPNHPEWTTHSRLIQRMKAPKEGCTTNEQIKVRLTPEQAWKVLGYWAPENAEARKKKKDHTSAYDCARNYALIATALLSGLRREELLSLKWRDIDLARSIITVRHGKGDKSRQSSLFGTQAHTALKAWRNMHHYNPVFDIVPVTAWRIFRRTGERCGLGKFSPHDARRTLLTEMLSTGSPVHEAQAQAGHEDGGQTLDYAEAPDAEQRVKTTKLRYGE